MSNHFLDHYLSAERVILHLFWEIRAKVKNSLRLSHLYRKGKENRKKSILYTLDLKLTTVVSSFEQKGLRQMWAHGQIAKIKGRKKVKPKMPADHYALLRSGLSFSSVLTTVYL